MFDWHLVRAIMIYVPIFGLFLLGLTLTVWSGVASLKTSQGVRLALDNISGMLVRLAAYVVGLIAVHEFIGIPLGLSW
jgi:hypothetical protein